MKGENELDTFCSVYKKDYRRFHIRPAKQFKDFDPFKLSVKDEEFFQKGDHITSLSSEEKDAIMKKMIDKIMRTVYMDSYSLESLQIFRGDPKKLYSPENDKLLTIARDVYRNKYPKFKTAVPLPTSRRVLGFCRPKNYYMGLSEYQDTTSKLGYCLLKKEADRGYWRLGPKHMPEIVPTVLKCKK